MKTKKLLLCACLLITGTCANAQSWGSTDTVKINSTEMDMEREILVYTPNCYKEDSISYFNVMYLFDAQDLNEFDLTRSMISFASDLSKRYIVVGIVSPTIPEQNYYRNNDLLPAPINEDPKTFFNGYYGNADKLMAFVNKELMPYIDGHYRTKSTKVAIGLSLGASFILSSFVNDPNTYDAYLAISPNFAYDKDRLANAFIGFDFKKVTSNKFFYISNSGQDFTLPGWKAASEKVYSFLDNTKLPPNIDCVVNHFPNDEHYSGFPPALFNAMKSYFKYVDSVPLANSDRTYKVHITVTVPDKKDEVYITGSQPALANWKTDSLKMRRVSDLKREITVQVHTPVEVKFTKGSWENEAKVKGNEIYMGNIWIDPTKRTDFTFNIAGWVNTDN